MFEIRDHVSAQLRERYVHAVFSNGMQVYVLPRQTVTAYAALAVKCGGNDLKFRMTGTRKWTAVPIGTAHFLEHKLFAGADGVDASAHFAEIGAACDAYTTPDTTAYTVSCTDRLEDALRILLDFVMHPYLTAENVRAERDIITQELVMCEDNPNQLAYYQLMEALYHVHPARNPVGGSVASVRKITPQALEAFYRAFYAPSNMTLVVAGKIAPDTVFQICDAMMPQTCVQTAERMVFEEPPEIVCTCRTAKAQLSKPILYTGVKHAAVCTEPIRRMKETAALEVLHDILFGPSSRLYHTWYAQGAVNQRFGYDFTHTADISYAFLSAETAEPERLAEQFYRSILEEQRTHSITEAEFERCKRVMYACAVTMFESTEDLAETCLELAMDGGELFASIDAAASLTREDIFSALDSFYQPTQFAASIVMPL